MAAAVTMATVDVPIPDHSALIAALCDADRAVLDRDAWLDYAERASVYRMRGVYAVAPPAEDDWECFPTWTMTGAVFVAVCLICRRTTVYDPCPDHQARPYLVDPLGWPL